LIFIFHNCPSPPTTARTRAKINPKLFFITPGANHGIKSPNPTKTKLFYFFPKMTRQRGRKVELSVLYWKHEKKNIRKLRRKK